MWVGIAVMFVGCLVVAEVGRRGRDGGWSRPHVVGLRSPAALDSDEAWSVAQRVAGPYAVLAGLAGAFATVGAGAVAVAGASEGVVGAAILLAAALMVGLLLVGCVRGIRAARDVDGS